MNKNKDEKLDETKKKNDDKGDSKLRGIIAIILVALLVIILVVVLLLKSCGKTTPQAESFTLIYENNDERGITQFNKQGELTSIEMSFFDDGTEIPFSKYGFEYDNNHNITKSKCYDYSDGWVENPDSDLTFKDYVFENGKVKSYSTYYGDEKYYEVQNEYENGKLKSETILFTEGTYRYEKWVYEYDSDKIVMTKNSSFWVEIPDYSKTYVLTYKLTENKLSQFVYEKDNPNQVVLNLTLSIADANVSPFILRTIGQILVYDGCG